ncbi:MAG: Response regulator MprA [bacterium ADurb.Bin363]|nr:MAG: Response regulator MprA [bacterium ADurb.Bin363]
MKCLVVEDELNIRNMLKTMLSFHGVCDSARDGIKALQFFTRACREKEPYDIIFMDIMMPHMDGLETIKKIREIEKNMAIDESEEVKIIMVTALNDPDTVFEAYYQGGATAYLPKPFTPEDILEEIRKLGF